MTEREVKQEKEKEKGRVNRKRNGDSRRETG